MEKCIYCNTSYNNKSTLNRHLKNNRNCRLLLYIRNELDENIESIENLAKKYVNVVKSSAQYYDEKEKYKHKYKNLEDKYNKLKEKYKKKKNQPTVINNNDNRQIININKMGVFRAIPKDEIINDPEKHYRFLMDNDTEVALIKFIRKYYNNTPPNVIVKDIARKKIQIKTDDGMEYTEPSRFTFMILKSFAEPSIAIMRKKLKDLKNDHNRSNEFELCEHKIKLYKRMTEDSDKSINTIIRCFRNMENEYKKNKKISNTPPKIEVL